MIENPNAALVERTEADYPDEVPSSMGPRIKVLKGFRYDDPDKALDQLVTVLETKLVNVDAKLVEGYRNGQPVIRHYHSLREILSNPMARKRVRDAYNDRQIKELKERMVEVVDAPPPGQLLRESEFNLGLYDDEVSRVAGAQNVFPITDTVLPTTTSPYSKQMLFVDYLDMHRKCFEAATRNPVGKRISKIIPQFVLGRGVKGRIDNAEYQDAWDDFWLRNEMRLRIKALLRELVVYGEIFLRYFDTKDGLVVRSLDPMTIWDIVTAPEDLEDVKYYHQQFVILNNSAAVGVFLPASTLIIRHIPADEIDHFKINATSSEKRGRSELYAILSWLQRFKEFANDRVLLNKMRAMFALDVAVDGGTDELTTATEQFATPPGPGAVLVHNKAVEVEFKNANNNANEAKTDGEMILKIIAVGAGISEQFLGVSSAQTRAGALIQTEPDVKNFEDFREIVEEILIHASERVWESKRLKPKSMEFTFPSIAQEDRSTKLKDLALSEAMDWFSKARVATMAAREFEVTTYDYAKEKEEIRKERGTEPVIATGFQQLPKQAPAAPAGPGGPEPPGLLGPGGEPEEKPDVTQTSAQMGFKGDGGGRGLANTQATLNRPEFTRGGEKAAITGNKSSGTPLRHSAEGPRRGWSAKAREISLAVRRDRARRKQEQVMDGDDTGRTDSTDQE